MGKKKIGVPFRETPNHSRSTELVKFHGTLGDMLVHFREHNLVTTLVIINA